MINSKFMRIISVLGIIGLLTLQYFWLMNAYGMVERDIMEKSKGCLKEAVDEEVFERMGRPTFDTGKEASKIKEGHKKGGEELIMFNPNKFEDIIFICQNYLDKLGKPCSIKKVDSLYQKKIILQLGFVPQHKLVIIKNSDRFKIQKRLKINGSREDLKINGSKIYQKDSCKISDVIYENTIFLKMSAKNSIRLDITSPVSSVISKAKYIFAFSLLLVLLIGIILIFQFMNMVRDKEFTAFIKDFSRIMAHEMRTPVNGIYMLTSRIMSKDYLEEEKIENYHKESLNLCSKLLLAFDNLLLIAKSEQSKILAHKSQVDLRILIEKIVDKYRNNYFLSKTLKINTIYESEDCNAYLDTELIENTVVNLIENAIKYSRESVEISIHCAVENKHILLKVKDNGFGIPKSNLKNIFHLFSRGAMKDYSQIKGFGIGLYYVQKVVKAHQGKVCVNSEEGVGSEFVIDIPNRFL